MFYEDGHVIKIHCAEVPVDVRKIYNPVQSEIRVTQTASEGHMLSHILTLKW